jgi:hypothetical protein
MGPVRILHLVSRSQRRGAELVAVELARGLDSLGTTIRFWRSASDSTAARTWISRR